MGLKRNYQGIEGYFYRSGNKKLEPSGATIERAFYGHLGHPGDFVNTSFLNLSEFGLHFNIHKDNGVDTTFSVYDSKDIACVLRDLKVCRVDEIRQLRVSKRRVTMYAHNGFNYGMKVGEGDL